MVRTRGGWRLEVGGRFVLLLLIASAPACRGPVRSFEIVAPHVANLREQFNKDGGAVRIVILPAPT